MLVDNTMFKSPHELTSFLGHRWRQRSRVRTDEREQKREDSLENAGSLVLHHHQLEHGNRRCGLPQFNRLFLLRSQPLHPSP